MEIDVEVNFSKVRSISTMVGASGTVVELVEYYKQTPLGSTYHDVR